MESLAGPKASYFPATEREQRVPILREGDGGTVREEIGAGEGIYLKLETALGKMRRLPRLHYLFCGILVTLGILSAVMGFLAEYHSDQDKSNLTAVHGKCVYPGDAVIAFSNHAAMLLIAAQVLASVFGCYVSSSTDETPTDSHLVNSGLSLMGKYSTKFIITSWIFCLGALYNFFAGNMTRKDNALGGSCEIVKFGIFIKGSVFALASVSFGLLFYVTKYKTKAIVDKVVANANRFSQDKSFANARQELTEDRSPV